ncbi:MAG TPA: SUMF1/EgtB/PvdO family nonheme iron enzyme [Planctomycetota bacterium]|nr:SUMF1/EgtB/PvdO family nonheme iron enzyme [Planctomycetota bacterium]
MNQWVDAARTWFETHKKWVILGAAVVVLLIAGILIINLMSGEEEKKEIVKVEGPRGPDPKIARIADFVRQVEAADAKGEFKDALFALKQIAILDPNDPHLAAQRPRLEELVRRLEAWENNQRQIEVEKKEAQRLNTLPAWQKVLDLCAEADKNAPTERQKNLTKALLVPSRQYHAWARAREEEKKGNLSGAIDLAGEAIGLMEPPAELTAYKAELEKKQRKKDYDRAATAARKEPVPAKSYDLWVQAKPLAEDPKDVAEADAKIFALKPWADPAERDRRYAEAVKRGEAALAAGDFDAAEKAYKEAQALKVTELAPGQALTKVAGARRAKEFDTAVADARAAEEKKEWADAMEAYDRALRIRPADQKLLAQRRQLEETRRPPKITVLLTEASGIKVDFLLVKRGSFTMGDPAGPSDEKPHAVTIAKDYWMQTTELTQAQWAAVMGTKPWMSQSVPILPVEGVSWDDTQKFFEKLNPLIREQIAGRKASLPTEAEWEYACRAGTQTRWSFGNDEAQFDQYGWSSKSGVRGPQAVGQKPANAWGFFDMHGNLAEWCSDPYGIVDEKAAADSVQLRCVRGGSWNDRPASCRSSSRGKEQSTVSNLFIGFRMVLR